MSDKVKVVIEIPKEIYERCKEYKLWSYDAETLEGAVAQGTPLDSVKAEIQEKSVWYRGQTYDGLCIALKIIDKYIGKAESEEAE